jgi:hypothetical protein
VPEDRNVINTVYNHGIVGWQSPSGAEKRNDRVAYDPGYAEPVGGRPPRRLRTAALTPGWYEEATQT